MIHEFKAKLSFSILFSTLTILSAKASDSVIDNVDLFKQPGAITVDVEGTIPDNVPNKTGVISLLKGTQLTHVKTQDEPGIKKDVGYTFPCSAPWCLITAKYIRSLNFRPNLGDWGCGHGNFSSQAVISGANPWAIDSSLQAATEANKTIWQMKEYIPEGLNLKELYKASHVSVVNPGTKFMNRKNHINVAFNVIHYLSPSDADLFLKNLYMNTMDNGIIVLSSDTPHDNISNEYYKKCKEQGLKYPGYGIYSTSNVIYKDDLNKKGSVTRSAHRPTPQEEKENKFKMGLLYKGMYPLIPAYDNGRTISVDSSSPEGDFLGSSSVRPYYYASGHSAINKFDFNGLKDVLESAGFSVINGWYTDFNLSTLYPYDHDDFQGSRKSKVVVVAQKLVTKLTTEPTDTSKQ